MVSSACSIVPSRQYRSQPFQSAFAETLKYREFLKDAEKTGLEIELVTGEEVD